MKHSPLVLLLALSACGPGSAPSDPPTVVTPIMLEPPPINALFGFRERLELTSEQILQLDSISTAVKEQNNVLLEELQEKSQLTRSQTALMVGEEARPVLDQLRNNNLQAAEAVGRVLSTEQQAVACELFDMERDENRDERRAAAEERREERERRRQRVGGMQLDTTLIMMQRRIWPWCSASAPSPSRRGRRN